MKTYTDYNKLFNELGLKLTMQRLAVLEYLLNTKSHPSAEMIYNDLKKKYPTITLSTIYNTLEIFEKKGLVKRVPTFSGTARYDADLSPHIHLVITDKDQILDIYDEDIIKSIRNHLKKQHNLDVSTSNIYVVLSSST